MKTLEFHTPTQVDLRELFTLGLGSKQGDSSKIGHKGSGMKFTLAMLHRLGSSLGVTVDGKTWISEEYQATIRGAEHPLIRLTDLAGTSIDCHISTNAGVHTWKEPWFVLRELLQNCIDEGGRWYETKQDAAFCNGTIMRIELTPELEAAWALRDSWFNERHPEIIYVGGTPGLFYHGFLIYTAADWRWSYDVTTLIDRENLSEDRQMRNLDLNKLFAKVLEAAPYLPEGFYSTVLNSTDLQTDVAALNNAVQAEIYKEKPDCGGFKMALLDKAWVERHGDRACYTLEKPGSQEFYFADAAGYTPVLVRWHTQRLICYSSAIKSAASLMPAIDKRLATVAPKSLPIDALGKLKMALRLTRKLRPEGCEVQVVKAMHEADAINAAAFACINENKVLILEAHVSSAPLGVLVNTLVEEFMHIKSGAQDQTRKFEEALVSTIASMLMPKVRARDTL